MEQLIANTATNSTPWFAQQCKKLTFKTLARIDNAYLTINDSQGSHCFGDKSSQLHAQIDIKQDSVYIDFIKQGDIGAAQAFIQNQWSSPDLTKVIQLFARNQKQLDSICNKMSWLAKLKNTLFHKKNANTEQGSKDNILAHYDLGNELYKQFLDPSMMYSSAIYSKDHACLTSAQQHKLHTICERLELTQSDHLLEIGTGWGGLAIYAAQNYGCKVTTTTISDAQHAYAKQRIKQLHLEGQVTLLREHYRKLTGKYDKLVSIEMIEAVGHEFHATFFAKCDSLLKCTGKMLLQAITIADQRYDYYRNNVDFIQRYIFPGGCLPSIQVISKHVQETTDMVIDEVQDIGLHYAKTLQDWSDSFNSNWSEISPKGYDEQFKRLWNYYFAYCEGGFLERVISTHHVVMRKPNYKSHNDIELLAY